MTTPPFLTAPALAAEGVAHGFFSRRGGVSEGVYASLNTGPGSEDDPRRVAKNRARCAAAVGVDRDALLTNHQVHSASVVIVEAPWDAEPPKADGLVTATPGLAVGVLAADCMPWLFLDPDARVVGAAHAGWRGALAGVLERTVERMIACGARADRIRAALGPCLRQPNFEVGVDLVDEFVARYGEADRFFAQGVATDKRQFDLAGFGAWRLRETGVARIDDLKQCTLGAPDVYFSYRAARRRGDEDYGRNLSAIALLL